MLLNCCCNSSLIESKSFILSGYKRDFLRKMKDTGYEKKHIIYFQ